MYDLDQILSTIGDFINAAIHPSVANLPAGFLILVFAVLIIAALPEGAREKMRLASLAAVGLIVSLANNKRRHQEIQASPRIEETNKRRCRNAIATKGAPRSPHPCASAAQCGRSSIHARDVGKVT